MVAKETMTPAPRKYPDELRERAVRLVRDDGQHGAIARVADRRDINRETLRNWVNGERRKRQEPEVVDLVRRLLERARVADVGQRWRHRAPSTTGPATSSTCTPTDVSTARSPNGAGLRAPRTGWIAAWHFWTTDPGAVATVWGWTSPSMPIPRLAAPAGDAQLPTCSSTATTWGPRCQVRPRYIPGRMLERSPGRGRARRTPGPSGAEHRCWCPRPTASLVSVIETMSDVPQRSNR